MRSEEFLTRYRVLEGLLEKRYEGQKVTSSSVVIEYLREEDSEPIRVYLDLLREIRNILSHNTGSSGEPVIEPSQEMLDRLNTVIAYVSKPRVAAGFGTPVERILCAHANDNLVDIMRNMLKNGYSHVPVLDHGRIDGVFSVKSVFDFLAQNGFDRLNAGSRIADLGSLLRFDNHSSERYMFVEEDTSIVSVRNAFETHTQRNNRLGIVFVTRSGRMDEPLICMITPWDVLNDQKPEEGDGQHDRGNTAGIGGDNRSVR